MAEAEAHSKLQVFLHNPSSLTHEIEVVYLMVELRKYMEYRSLGRHDRYAILKFYCDWILHTHKTEMLTTVKEMFDQIHDYCVKRSNAAEDDRTIYDYTLDDFLRFSNLRLALVSFFKEYHLNTSLLDSVERWNNFVEGLRAILKDQPIRNYDGRGKSKLNQTLRKSESPGLVRGVLMSRLAFTNPSIGAVT